MSLLSRFHSKNLEDRVAAIEGKLSTLVKRFTVKTPSAVTIPANSDANVSFECSSDTTGYYPVGMLEIYNLKAGLAILGWRVNNNGTGNVTFRNITSSAITISANSSVGYVCFLKSSVM